MDHPVHMFSFKKPSQSWVLIQRVRPRSYGELRQRRSPGQGRARRRPRPRGDRHRKDAATRRDPASFKGVQHSSTVTRVRKLNLFKFVIFPLQMLRFSALCGPNEQKFGELLEL